MALSASRSSYTSSDFLDWFTGGKLVISPKFQRRGVWKNPAKSYLIDTLIRGHPVPPIYLRVSQSKERDRQIREVIDGQQRISSVLEFMSGKFSLAKNVATDFPGAYFDDLPTAARDAVRNYSFICEVFHGISDDQVLEIFRRVNTYSVPLNAQELRNGRWFGEFKETAYGLASKYLTFWRTNKIFSEQKIARMAEVEMVSELMILLIEGVQDKKKSIDTFYEKYDESFSGKDRVVSRFERVLKTISTNCPSLSQTAFSRPPLFYSLFAAVSHRLYGVKNVGLNRPRTGALTTQEETRLEDVLVALTDVLQSDESDMDMSEKDAAFVTASQRQTDNIKPRKTVITEVYRRAFK